MAEQPTRRASRVAALDEAFNGKSFRITGEISLMSYDEKFTAWITGARGRKGFEIINVNGGEFHIVGRTTLDDANERGAIVNYSDWIKKGQRGRPRKNPVVSPKAEEVVIEQVDSSDLAESVMDLAAEALADELGTEFAQSTALEEADLQADDTPVTSDDVLRMMDELDNMMMEMEDVTDSDPLAA